MAVSIRLRRMGRKKQPHYRIVVADSAHPRDGRFVESIGFYKPLTRPARLVLDLARVDHWIGRGAQPSGTVKSLIGKARRGGDATVALGELDVAAEKAKRAEMLAERRSAEKQKEKAGKEKAGAKAAAAVAAAAPAEAEVAPETAAEAPAGAEPGAAELTPGDAKPATKAKSGATGQEDGDGDAVGEG